jgi:lathosterol oxidase
MKYIIIYILHYDFFYYFMHRLLHTKYFYHIHKIHHLAYKPKYTDFFTVSYLEHPLSSIGLYLALYLYGIYIYQLLATICLISIRGMMEHDDRFSSIVGNHHLQHHTYFYCNYGEYWIDYIFGTVHNKNKLYIN